MTKKRNSAEVMADQVLFEAGPEGEWAIHNLLMNGPGSEAVNQAKVPLARYIEELHALHAAQEPQFFGLVPPGISLRGAWQGNGVMIFVIEVPPGVHTLRWLRDDSPAAFGSKATYRDVQIALPYQYFFVAVTPQAELCTHHSIYFLNQQLLSETERLGECHYYNCSVDAYRVHCWICTQNLLYLPQGQPPTPLGRACAFVEWFFASAFNASSEHYEGQSFWSKNRGRLGDARVASITAWEEATRADPDFIREIPWCASLTVQEVCAQLLPPRSRRPQNLSDFVRIIRNCE